MASPQPLQFPLRDVGRRFGGCISGSAGIGGAEGACIRLARVTISPSWMAGSIGDSGASRAGSTLGGASGLVNRGRLKLGGLVKVCVCGEAGFLGDIFSIDVAMSSIRLSIFVAFDGFLPFSTEISDVGGLDLELPVLTEPYPEPFDDDDSLGV